MRGNPPPSREKLSGPEGTLDVAATQEQQVDADESDQQGGNIGRNGGNVNSGKKCSHDKSSEIKIELRQHLVNDANPYNDQQNGDYPASGGQNIRPETGEIRCAD